MNIVIEGPDAVGKSLYAKEIEKFGYTYIKCSPGEHATSSNLDFDYFKNLSNLDNCVFDRFFISELVYSNLYNRNSALSFDDANKLMSSMINNSKFIFLYTSDVDLLKNRCIERNELNYIDELEKQNELFIKFFWVFSAYESKNIYLINVSEYNNIESVKDIIKSIIEEV